MLVFEVENLTKIHTCVTSSEILSTENKFNGIIFGWKASECQNQSPVVRLLVSQNFIFFLVGKKFDYFVWFSQNENSKSREIYFFTLCRISGVDVASSLFHWMIKHDENIVMQTERKGKILWSDFKKREKQRNRNEKKCEANKMLVETCK